MLKLSATMPSRALMTCLAVASVMAASSGCSPQKVLSIMPGVVNDTHNRTLRRELIALGMGDVCRQLMTRSVPLKLDADHPALGRFFPATCQVDTLANGDLYVQFGGKGYAWSNLTQRIGFKVSAAIEYDQDFMIDGSTLFLYLRPAAVTSRSFEPTVVEGTVFPETPITDILPGTDPQGFVKQVGPGLFAFAIGDGITVVRESDGAASFAISMAPMQKPMAPFERGKSDGRLYANERIELHREQRDFLGPIEVSEVGMGLYLTANVDGAPQIDVQIHGKDAGETWLQQYVTSKENAAPPSTPLLDETVTATPSTQPLRRFVAVPPGSYYVVLDNTSTAGKTAPGGGPNDDRAALVGIGIEVGDAP